jgi:hypothetical protein
MLIIYCPEGCVKTTLHADRFKEAFDYNHVMDDWDGEEPIPGADWLVLTSVEGPYFGGRGARVITFDEACSRARFPVESTWVISVDARGVDIRRLHNGKPIESYGRLPAAEAAVALVAISQGFQPPRGLCLCGIPLD